ncbi:MAG: phosphoribosylamine--glycine ligase [Zetaproteobacteria bacterium CG12_big_fil_rev_8_21_14_0_65_55_1124]|nr:MAG: phosphoribosylamine--glycine ligase [Zetaproteobacteria bacterium CG1_02_55_237]PIS20096.1 MAG: phosphoribosylamine--glycine ligase [Zetaproteobacteria bacterium CG08_land_8_20_14_0_20_55_17]PIW43203.1 MAG: phosphoribosylamine--glycine ligase [Zetaproteobacteria bacterium CG12_big_fil_rev_8_21_14_0_65_55_1124]PIY53174.1 MAG: phosphoribosylamine--glycine ligase [Zetaproteobacteria bacterium CG_4_10_14_0_8_um_filter_55_43]PIZ39685.1 MAG: phosphoribosylamine--glycine ligase [Zetaproteobact
MKVMVVGGGGREHALCWKLKRSPSVSEVVCAPGNPGIARDARCVSVGAEDIEGLMRLAAAEQPRLVVVGPEVPLVLGLADRLRAAGFAVFGPDQAAAELEGSKSFSKQLMADAGVPTARFEVHTIPSLAEQTIREWGAPIVVKASGLAAGKGVIVAHNVEEAVEAAHDMLAGNSFGSAGSQVVIEECLIGEEASCLFIVSGDTILPLDSSQDHKALLNGDKGPNTGGMGAYSPAPCVTPEVAQMVLEQIARPTIATLKARGIEFIGTLYAGVMLTSDGPKTLEFNVRFGDPECQPLMSRLQSDLGEVLLAAAEKRLAGVTLDWDKRPALCVVVASDGYPESFEKGQAIGGLDAVEKAGATVFHAGTAEKDGAIVNTGGRVLGVTALGGTVGAAQKTVYAALEKLDWPGGIYRTDIGYRAVAREKGE